MPFNIGPWQLVLILLILLLVFGARRLPEIGRALGTSAREFKDGIMGEHKSHDRTSSDTSAEAESVHELDSGPAGQDGAEQGSEERQEHDAPT